MHLRIVTAIIAALAAATTISSAPLDKRIVRGTPVEVGELPMFAQLKVCGGSFIGPKTVLTGKQYFVAASK